MSKLCVGKPIRLTHTDIIPIEMVSIGNFTLGHACWLYGSKIPAAIVVCDSYGVKVLDIQEQRWSLEELVREVPGLESALAQFARFRE